MHFCDGTISCKQQRFHFCRLKSESTTTISSTTTSTTSSVLTSTSTATTTLATTTTAKIALTTVFSASRATTTTSEMTTTSTSTTNYDPNEIVLDDEESRQIIEDILGDEFGDFGDIIVGDNSTEPLMIDIYHVIMLYPNISVPFETEIEWTSQLRNPYSSVYLSNVVTIANFLTAPITAAVEPHDQASFRRVFLLINPNHTQLWPITYGSVKNSGRF